MNYKKVSPINYKENSPKGSNSEALTPPPKKVTRVGLTADKKGVKKIRAPIMAADRKFLGRHLLANIKQLTSTKTKLETIPGNTTITPPAPPSK